MGRVVRTLKNSWSIFKERPPQERVHVGGMTMPPRSVHRQYRYFNERTIVSSIYTRLAIDLSTVKFMHCKLDDDGVIQSIVKDDLHSCLTLDTNVDQTAQAFFFDLAYSLFENGHITVVPIETSGDPLASSSYDIRSMRVGRVVGWYPRHVTVEVYDDRETDEHGNPVNGGVVKQVTVPKHTVGLIENPFYPVMNEPNGTLKRLQEKLILLDELDAATSSSKLDMLIQLPYTVRGESRQNQAAKRRQELRDQLKEDELGIGYIDVTEKVIQLNRPVNNKLPDQIQSLKDEVYADLGLTPEIMNGTASRDSVNNYYDRTIEPIAEAISSEFKRKFLTKTARSQGHSIEIYRDPLKLIPLNELSEIVDKLLRNAAVTANEIRPKIGLLPSKDPTANELRNPNMPDEDQGRSETSSRRPKAEEVYSDSELKKLRGEDEDDEEEQE